MNCRHKTKCVPFHFVGPSRRRKKNLKLTDHRSSGDRCFLFVAQMSKKERNVKKKTAVLHFEDTKARVVERQFFWQRNPKSTIVKEEESPTEEIYIFKNLQLLMVFVRVKHKKIICILNCAIEKRLQIELK